MTVHRENRLSPGQLHWILDWNEEGRSMPELLRDLEDLSPTEEQQIREIPRPLKLVVSYKEVPLESLIEITPDMAPYVQTFLKQLVRDISIPTNLQFRMPPPLFEGRDLQFNSLIPPYSNDLKSIAFRDGERLTLMDDKEAFQNLVREGVYKKGDYHIRFSWYPGRSMIQQWRYKCWAEACYQVGVQIPASLVGSEASIWLGLKQLVGGIAITLNRLTSLVPTWIPRYTPNEIEDKVTSAYFEWLQQDSRGFELVGSEELKSDEKLHFFPKSKDTIVHIPVIFEHASRGRLDYRTSIPSIRYKLTRMLAEAEYSVENQLGPKRMSIISKFTELDGEEVAVEKYLDLWREHLVNALDRRRRDIDALSKLPNLTDTVLDEIKANYAVAMILDQKEDERAKTVTESLERWTKAHPVLAQSQKFIDRQKEAIESGLESTADKTEMIKLLAEKGLNRPALLLTVEDEFERSKAHEQLNRELRESKKAATIEISFLKLPSQWNVVKIEGAYPDQSTYSLEYWHSVRVYTSHPLWRWEGLIIRSASWIWNSSIYLVHETSVAVCRWNLAGMEFSVATSRVDQTTGKIVYESKRTLLGRIDALLQWRRRVLEKARNSEHIIRIREGLYLDTCWAHFWTGTGTLVGSAAIITYTACETTALVVGTCFALVTSPIWSTTGNLIRLISNALFYDCDLDRGDDGASPLVRNQFGIPRLIFAGARLVYHTLKGAAVTVGGEIRHAWNRCWHSLMSLVLKRAEVPTKANGYFWETSGPAMKTPFVLIDCNTCLLSLLVYLSQQELSVAIQEMHHDLQLTRRSLADRIQSDSAGAFDHHAFRNLSQALREKESEYTSSLNAFTELWRQQRYYQKLIDGMTGKSSRNTNGTLFAGSQSQLRMTEHDLASFTSKASALAQKFYLEHYFPRLIPNELIRFWDTRNLVPGDWSGLVRDILGHHLFTPDILVPFEAASEDLVVEANRASGLEKIISEALAENDIVSGESTEYKVSHAARNDITLRPNHGDFPRRFTPRPL